MSRPLVISDCDEVILHMVAPFRDWLAEAHDIEFSMAGNDFSKALTHQSTGGLVEGPEIWKLLNLFFDTEMHRQQPIAGAVAAINQLGEQADVVILTNLGDHRQVTRTQQLREVGIEARVFTNQGPKGPALQAILDEYQPSRAVFIDDLPQHLGSVAEVAPHVIRLHLCGEPLLAPHIACAHALGHAHARIDDWDSALPWLLGQLEGVKV
ncbi:MAG TPA: HAD family hydrolase [Novosphingobium sp.]|nr:HAD family hydrolase [Novosphingobium sp.]